MADAASRERVSDGGAAPDPRALFAALLFHHAGDVEATATSLGITGVDRSLAATRFPTRLVDDPTHETFAARRAG